MHNTKTNNYVNNKNNKQKHVLLNHLTATDCKLTYCDIQPLTETIISWFKLSLYVSKIAK